MTGRDLSSNILGGTTVAPVVIAATTNGSQVDCLDCGSACALISLGDEGETITSSKHYIFKIQGSNTSGSGDVDLTDAMMIEPTTNLITLDAPGDAPGIYQMGFETVNYRWYRVVITEVGTVTTGTPMSILIVKGNTGSKPTGAVTAGT